MIGREEYNFSCTILSAWMFYSFIDKKQQQYPISVHRKSKNLIINNKPTIIH